MLPLAEFETALADFNADLVVLSGFHMLEGKDQQLRVKVFFIKKLWLLGKLFYTTQHNHTGCGQVNQKDQLSDTCSCGACVGGQRRFWTDARTFLGTPCRLDWPQ
jgi:hypothetical protein